jgi:hypothetical protein
MKGSVRYVVRCIPRIPGEQLKFALAASAALSLVLYGCAEIPTAVPTHDSPSAHLVVSVSESTPPPKGGVHAQTAAITAAIDSIGNLFGVPTQPAPNSHGIPQQLAADSANVGVIETAISDQVALMNAKISAGTATPAEILALRAKCAAAHLVVVRLNEDWPGDGSVSIYDMFEMQLLMNHLSQMSEMSTAVVDALNQALIDMGRDPKGA